MSFITTIREDIANVKREDPAAQNGLVIFLTYPGLHAKWNHVPEHWLWNHGCKSLARIMSQITRHMTGVEIHPAAHIGKHFFIDHAMGVIIGETTIIGDNCTLYQGVPGRIVKRNGCRVFEETFDAKRHREFMPDPGEEASARNRASIAENARRVTELEAEVAKLTALVRQLTDQAAKK